MHPRFLDLLRCPETGSALRLEAGKSLSNGIVISGELRAEGGRCYPIIDGVPILVSEPVRYLERFRHQVERRRDLHPAARQFVDRSYAFSDIALAGQRELSQYARAHYPAAGERFGATGMDRAVEEISLPGGLVLDLGCATGRWTLVAAERARFALGVDLDFSMVRAAREMRASGSFPFPDWKGGRVFGAGEVQAPELASRRADFVVADVMCPPVADDELDVLLALNLTDTVPEPAQLIAGMGRLLKGGGRFLHSTPYRWNSAVTSPEKQLDPGRLREALAASSLELSGDARTVSWLLPGAPGETHQLNVEVLFGVAGKTGAA